MRGHKRILVVAYVGMALVVSLSLSTFGPRCWRQWRQHSIQTALDNDAGPSVWWLPSWKEQYYSIQHTQKNLTDLRRIAEDALAKAQVCEASLRSIDPSSNEASVLGSQFIDIQKIAEALDAEIKRLEPLGKPY
jgi:hypothetical protein